MNKLLTRICSLALALLLVLPLMSPVMVGAEKISEKEIKLLIDLVADLVSYGGEQIVFLSGSMPTVVGEDSFTQFSNDFKYISLNALISATLSPIYL